jgi:hypothetical protein
VVLCGVVTQHTTPHPNASHVRVTLCRGATDAWQRANRGSRAAPDFAFTLVIYALRY